MNDILSQLNKSQQDAVLYMDGPSLVIAGAGSGKTRVLTYKIAYLLQQGMNPWNILALTFTNKAAKEMVQRIGRIVGEQYAAQLNMGTFHSVFSHILRIEATNIGYNSNFTIYDETDSKSLVKTIIKEMKLDDKVYKPGTISGRISMAKNHLILPDAYPSHSELMHRDEASHTPATSQIYKTYCDRCKKANAMDFDDLLVNTWTLFNTHKEILDKYVARYHFVLVDEYQDTNYVQQSIVVQLTSERQRVCVVGDDAQSIYSFRGANIDNILNFRELYKDTKLFKLEQNYRSTQFIVQAANSLIKHNKRQIPKDVYSRNSEGEKLIIEKAISDKEESYIVCNDIQRMRHKENLDYNDFAILYRTNSQSRSFEEQMRKDNIPYRIYGGMSFYQRKEVKDIIAYFRMVSNPDDEEAFRRIINYPTRGIGNVSVNKIKDCALNNNVSLWQVIANPVVFGLNINSGTLNKLNAFKELIQGFIDRLSNEDAYTIGKDIIISSGIKDDIYATSDADGLLRQENLNEFLSGMKDFVDGRREEDRGDAVSLVDYLQEISLLTDLDSDKDTTTSKVKLMTIHSAKGLEFPVVFIVGVEENIFPSPMCCDSPRQLEEERRLFYVAITRAEKHCIITCAQNRFRFGKIDYDTPSRFLKDINPSYIRKSSNEEVATQDYGSMGGFGSDRSRGYSANVQNRHPVGFQFMADPKESETHYHADTTRREPFSTSFKKKLQEAGFKRVHPQSLNSIPSSSTVSSSQQSVKEGDMIEHQRFGEGKVIKVEGTGENAKATVAFKNAGTKQLLLKFARFTVIK